MKSYNTFSHHMYTLNAAAQDAGARVSKSRVYSTAWYHMYLLTPHTAAAQSAGERFLKNQLTTQLVSKTIVNLTFEKCDRRIAKGSAQTWCYIYIYNSNAIYIYRTRRVAKRT